MQQASCKGQLGTWFDEFGRAHHTRKIGYYTVCLRLGAFGSKKPKRPKNADCTGVRPSKGHPRTCLKRLLEGKNPETGRPLRSEDRWREEAKARHEVAEKKKVAEARKRKLAEEQEGQRKERLRLVRTQPPPPASPSHKPLREVAAVSAQAPLN